MDRVEWVDFELLRYKLVNWELEKPILVEKL
jgi:hypothetical protein